MGVATHAYCSPNSISVVSIRRITVNYSEGDQVQTTKTAMQTHFICSKRANLDLCGQFSLSFRSIYAKLVKYEIVEKLAKILNG